MTSLHFDSEGSDTRPALLLLHGFMSSNLQWSLNRSGLRGHFRLIAVELWGHGKSPTPRDPERYRVARYLEQLEDIRRKLLLDRWWVCGQSFGAGIVIRYALEHPEAVRGLVVTNSRSALNDVSREAGEGGGLEFFEALDARRLPFHPCHAKRFPPELKARMEAAADAIPGYALWQATTTTARQLSCRAVAPQLSVPTLLVNGRYEKVFQDDREFAAANIPGIEVVDLDAGHSVNVEAPSGFDEAVIEFARRHA